MKKLFLLLTIIFILSGCAKVFVLYEENYGEDQREEVLRDIYHTLYLYEVDSIPLEDWLVQQGNHESGYFIERAIVKKEKDATYFMVFKTCYFPDSVSYSYEIECRTKDKAKWTTK